MNEVDTDEGDAHPGVDHDALVEDAVEHVDGRVPLDARSPAIGAEYIGRRCCAQAFARLCGETFPYLS